MTTAFDPRTAYRSQGQFKSFRESVTWEKPTDDGISTLTGLTATFGDFDTPELQSLAAGLALTSESAAIVVWQPDVDEDAPLPEGSTAPQAFAPASGHIIRRESVGGEGWVILSATRSRFGHWLLVCDREVVNG